MSGIQQMRSAATLPPLTRGGLGRGWRQWNRNRPIQTEPPLKPPSIPPCQGGRLDCRTFGPRNDEEDWKCRERNFGCQCWKFDGHCKKYRTAPISPTSSLRGAQRRGNPVGAKRPCGRTGLPRAFGPRNDEEDWKCRERNFGRQCRKFDDHCEKYRTAPISPTSSLRGA
jgi:hypothetical protein